MTVTDDAFDNLVALAFEDIPEDYRKLCEGLAIRAEPFASAETLTELEIDDPYDLLGLYHGISLARRSVSTVTTLPDTVLIYRRPILAYAELNGLELFDVIKHVLVHEIGHHFGFSDDDMEAIEAAADEPES